MFAFDAAQEFLYRASVDPPLTMLVLIPVNFVGFHQSDNPGRSHLQQNGCLAERDQRFRN